MPHPLTVTPAERLELAVFDRAGEFVGATGTCEWCALADLLQDPQLLAPPPAIVPRLCWQGRITLLSGREKSGKSSLVGAAAAALALGQPFLGESVTQGTTTWLALDEPLHDAVRRFSDLRVANGVAFATVRPTVEALAGFLRASGSVLLVIDSLNAYASGLVEDSYRPEQWLPLFADLRAAIAGTDAGIIVIHHLKKSVAEFAGSHAIGAAADVLLTLGASPSDPLLRDVGHQGRVHGTPFSVRFDPSSFGFGIASGALGLDAQVLAAVMREPGISANAVRAAVGARKSDVLAALRRMEGGGLLEDRGGQAGSAWFSGDFRQAGRNHSGTTSQTASGTSGNQPGTSGNHPEPLSGTAPVPPLQGGGNRGAGIPALGSGADELLALVEGQR